MGPSPAAALTIRFLVPHAMKGVEKSFLEVVHLDDSTKSDNVECTVSASGSNEIKENTNYIEINRPQELDLTNRTFTLDCSQENIHCTEVICSSGSLTERDFLVIPLKLNFSGHTIVGKYITFVFKNTTKPVKYLLFFELSAIRLFGRQKYDCNSR